MPDPRPAPSRIGLLSSHLPAALRNEAAVIWCRTTAELVVLAQDDPLRAAVVDARVHGVDGDLIDLVRSRGGVVVVVDPRQSTIWEALGASVVAEVPPALGPLLEAVEAAPTTGQTTWVSAAVEQAALVAVVDAPGGDGATAATSLAGTLAVEHLPHGAVVLADLTLDAPHRAVHGLDRYAPGLPELLATGRFGDPSPAAVGAALHRLPGGVLLLPGLRHHHDWVSLGRRSVQAALDALRACADIVVVHVDHDLEGEAETGSFDIEDRNVLARSTIVAADLVVVCGSASSAGRAGLHRRLEQLAAFGVPVDQTVSVLGTRRRSARRLVRAVGSLLATGVRSAAVPEEALPEQIVPGTLGHWAQDRAAR